MKRTLLRSLWTIGGVVAFVLAVIAMVTARFGMVVMLLIVCIVCLGTAMVIHRRITRQR